MGPEAFAELYERHKRDVWSMAYFTLRDRGESEDVVQETFLKAFRSLDSIRRGESVRSWLLTICRRTCLDRMRAARPAISLEDVPEPGADPDAGIDLRRALEALPAEEREAFFLVDVLGCHSDEAAEICGLRAASTLRSRVARARRALAPAVLEGAEAQPVELWGLFHARGASALVAAWTAGAPPAPGLREQVAGDADLLAFFERLDGQIPRDRSVLATIDRDTELSMRAAARWLARHPRWQLHRAASHGTWLAEAQRLLGDRPVELDGEEPFLWTQAR